MKKFILVFLALCLMLGVTGCSQSKSTLDPQVVTQYLEALKTGSFVSAKDYLESVPETFDYNDNDVMKVFFSKMAYEVGETKLNTSEGVCVVKIKLPDTTKIYDDMMNSIGEDVQKLQASNDEDKAKASNMMIAFMLDRLKSENVTMTENTVEVVIKVVDGKTIIVPDEALSKALSGIPSNESNK